MDDDDDECRKKMMMMNIEKKDNVAIIGMPFIIGLFNPSCLRGLNNNNSNNFQAI